MLWLVVFAVTNCMLGYLLVLSVQFMHKMYKSMVLTLKSTSKLVVQFLQLTLEKQVSLLRLLTKRFVTLLTILWL